MEGISDLEKQLLARRGVESDEAIRAFLEPDYETQVHDPFLFADMEKAVDRVLHAIAENEYVAVYADFDCDGIPGASVLSDTFKKIGFDNFEVYLPHRDLEGYGFHTDAIEALASRGTKLIITVDVGTTAVDAVSFAREKGIDVIVTDHHEIVGTLPDAFAILNPKLPPYPFPDLCGAGVAFKFACALLSKGKQLGIESFVAIPDGWEKWLLDLVAIATVADMVPLVGENRALAFWGLRVLRKTRRLGIRALCTETRVKVESITEDDIGFSIAPRVNAASRMGSPDVAFKLLTSDDAKEAEQLASHLEGLNDQRKGAAGAIVRQAKKSVNAQFREDEKVGVVGNPEWKPALLGLAANSVLGERTGVVCLWGRDGNGVLKGSCRSDGTISLAELFTVARDAFDECGGHANSGGFSVSHERVHLLHERLAEAARVIMEKSDGTGVSPVIEHDVRMPLRSMSSSLLRDLSQLAPFGIGNKKPIFLIDHARVVGVKSFGKENAHVEVSLDGDGMRMRSFDFFRSVKDFSHTPHEAAEIRMLATLERDSFRGAGAIALRIVDVLAA